MKKTRAQKTKKAIRPIVNKQLVGFIGAGNMARAMMKIFKNFYGLAATDIDGQKLEEVHEMYAVKKAANIRELVERSDVIIIAVKPDSAGNVLKEIQLSSIVGKTVVSIVAGLTINKIQQAIGKTSIVRVMPNTPVLVNEGVCAYSLSKEYDEKSIGETLIKLACRVCIKLDEDKINAVTAISGSGPAYFFYIAEAMVTAGLEMGLKGDHLRGLIGQTMKGAGEMILKNAETPDVLRAKVTSKGGTTEQAIKVMDDRNMKPIIIDAVRAAKRRADELGK
jgi:pyrroline-5-carboxylate reductase